MARGMLKGRKGILIVSSGEGIPNAVLERGFVNPIEAKTIPELVKRLLGSRWQQGIL